jgi:hypothetical protein
LIIYRQAPLRGEMEEKGVDMQIHRLSLPHPGVSASSARNTLRPGSLPVPSRG